jgi:hypothetical protein
VRSLLNNSEANKQPNEKKLAAILMVTKDIIILANSVKKKGHCIAGKDTTTREWIRLINNFKFESGDATPFFPPGLKKLCGDRDGPELGAHVQIRFSGPCPIYCQPENWEIDGTPWKIQDKFSDEKLRSLIDKEYPIWLGNSTYGQPDSISSSICNDKEPLKSSLVFLELTASKHKPQSYIATNYFGDDSPHLKFLLNGIEYDLPIKDHEFRSKLLEGEIKPGEYDSLLVTLGVGQLFEEMQAHYKLIVGIVQSS